MASLEYLSRIKTGLNRSLNAKKSVSNPGE
jgi:hypothetical protein